MLYSLLFNVISSASNDFRDLSYFYYLGACGARYNINPEQVELFHALLLKNLQKWLGSHWTEEVESAWNIALELAHTGFLKGLRSKGDDEVKLEEAS